MSPSSGEALCPKELERANVEIAGFFSSFLCSLMHHAPAKGNPVVTQKPARVKTLSEGNLPFPFIVILRR